MILEGYHFFGAILKFSRRKKRKTMSSQEGTNQSMAVLPVQFVSFLLLSFPFLSFLKVLSDNFMPGYDAVIPTAGERLGGPQDEKMNSSSISYEHKHMYLHTEESLWVAN